LGVLITPKSPDDLCPLFNSYDEHHYYLSFSYRKVEAEIGKYTFAFEGSKMSQNFYLMKNYVVRLPGKKERWYHFYYFCF
jgi:hypothetical protein